MEARRGRAPKLGRNGGDSGVGRGLGAAREEDGMYEGEIVLCAANSYTKQYYFNDEFDLLPQSVKDELKIMCVLYTEDVGGILALLFDGDGNLQLRTSADDGDLLYDDIGSALKVKQIRQERRDLLESLETYFKVFYLGEELEEE